MRQPPNRAPLSGAGRPECEPVPESASESVPPPPAARRLETLKKRAEFLACARARKAHAHAMVVQGRRRPASAAEGGAGGVRVGLTASRKVGKAVARNRARRRLREAARRVLPRQGRDGWDYVLIARSGTTLARPFTRLVADLERALRRLHGEEAR